MKELKPVRERSEYYEAIEKYLSDYLKKMFYLPLIEALGAKHETLTNSKFGLIEAIASGQIQFVDGHFEGEFNSVISKELKKLGAVWDRTHGSWKIPQSKLTNDMRSAIGASYSRFHAMASRVDAQLQKIAPVEIAENMNVERLIMSSAIKMGRDIDETLESITVKANFTDDQKKQLAEKYTNNMKISIQNFSEEQVVKLRKSIQRNVFKGFRYEDMIKTIQRSYGVSKSKAKQIARQETKLLNTEIKQTRYKDAGCNDYKWRCVAGSPQHPVRATHKALDGKIFSWDNPPIVDEHGNRKHPGQDYGCRCTAVPIVRF